MPIYEYECPVCGRFEVIQKFSDRALTTCPQCSEKGNEIGVTKAVSAAAFHLKGTGWYKTDYSKSSPGSTTGKSAASTPDAPSTSSSSDSSSSSSPSTPPSSASGSSSSEGGDSGKKGACGPSCGCH